MKHVVQVQGSLDGLCAIYAAINAISMLLAGRLDCEDLFAAIVRHIGPGLATIILNGTDGAKLEHKVLKPCIGFLLGKAIELQYKVVSASTLDEYWALIQDHYDDNGSGSVLFSIAGSYDHWTCASKVTRRCIFLEDSSAWKQRLYRSRVTIAEPTQRQPHSLMPGETFLLSIS